MVLLTVMNKMYEYLLYDYDLWINVSCQKQLFNIKHCYKVQT